MKLILASVLLAITFVVGAAHAQTRVSVSVSVGTPHVSGYVVIGRPRVHRSRIVVVDARRVRLHRSRLVVVRRHHHRHHYCDHDSW